jgi:hypothetical protein
MEKKYAASIDALVAFLDEINPQSPGWTHQVYLWGAEEFSLRVSEVGAFGPSAAGGTAGWAAMRSDPDCLALVLAAEDFLLMHACEWFEERDGELERAKAKLRFLLTSPFKEFVAAEERYLRATGWMEAAGGGKFKNWTHPEVMSGRTHTQPAAVRRQQERDTATARTGPKPCPNCGGEFQGLDPAHDPDGMATAEARRAWEEKRAHCTVCKGVGTVA